MRPVRFIFSLAVLFEGLAVWSGPRDIGRDKESLHRDGTKGCRAVRPAGTPLIALITKTI